MKTRTKESEVHNLVGSLKGLTAAEFNIELYNEDTDASEPNS